MKTCKTCKIEKPTSDFYLARGKPRAHCKECTKSHMRGRYHRIYKSDPEYREERRAYGREHYTSNKEKYKETSAKHRLEQRLACIKHYGPNCRCCGESRIEFLGIDHINGGGAKHRREIGSVITRWLVRNNFPDGFRVLCHNCNMSLGLYGYCPHNNGLTQASS